MLENKSMYIANFNCTFGKDNKPMLEHFEDIILPAFQSNYIREHDGNKYFFDSVKLTMVNGQFMLVGLIIKRTKLEIKSLYEEEKGLVRTNKVVPSDPYSYFLINLKNHRLVLVKNQKGSPSLSNFSSTAKHVLSLYVKETNREIEEKDAKLPKANLNVVAIPFAGVIKEELKRVKKIKRVTLRFYPLNGDVSTNETFNYLREMLGEVDSNSGYTQFNTPKNREKIAELLDDTKGLVKPSVQVVYKNGSLKTLRDEEFTEEMKIPLDDQETFQENINNIAAKAINREEFDETSEENQKIYERFFDGLMSLYNKLLR
ncbi:hypothetical protein AT864_01520 [Anoxybacillus sp. P3H1B]|uniref:hypothetical protein n=1 Tax=Anoxybacillus sp. P3H1B TaxID=1769293 RepID=UPI0007940A6E|nr:hypothetical protein [Anoxybacillus sp. P3H1B]KXG09960.1 hypothetical protein AT864_01520 [Anoxybacillus sp. P3H1B]